MRSGVVEHGLDNAIAQHKFRHAARAGELPIGDGRPGSLLDKLISAVQNIITTVDQPVIRVLELCARHRDKCCAGDIPAAGAQSGGGFFNAAAKRVVDRNDLHHAAAGNVPAQGGPVAPVILEVLAGRTADA